MSQQLCLVVELYLLTFVDILKANKNSNTVSNFSKKKNNLFMFCFKNLSWFLDFS